MKKASPSGSRQRCNQLRDTGHRLSESQKLYRQAIMGCFCAKEAKKKREVKAISPQKKKVVEEIEISDEMKIKAALLIQKWYRKYVAKLEARRRATWQVFQTLEYKNEKDQMGLYNFFNDLLLHSGGDDDILLKALRGKDKQADEAEIENSTNPDNIEVESGYTVNEHREILSKFLIKGIHLQFPLDAHQLPKLCKFFQEKGVIHVKYALGILHATRNLLKGMPSWHQVSVNHIPFVTVCGDLHGQMDDLMLIFYKNGYPDRKNPYIFNGDFVDRGTQSIEVSLLLFAYFLVFPKSIFVNRGNHEDQVMNMRYGFVKEVMDKYQQHSAKLVKTFADTFSWLPICSVIDKKVLVCHGGISNKTNLAEIGKVNRHQYVSVLNPPQDESYPEGHAKRINFQEWRQILDMLWSDPKPQNGCEPNTFRGGGCYFGPDITNLVLKKHKFKLLIRSHECKPEGFEWCHDDKCLTLFSASNYYEEDSNKGAFVKITKDYTRDDTGNIKPELFQFQVKHGNVAVNATAISKVTKTEDTALASLKEKIYGCKGELTEEFKKSDKANKGFVSVNQWCEAMKSVTGLDLPWRTMKSKLAEGDTKGNVRYMSTFEKMTLEQKGQPADDSMEQFYKHRNTLTQIFNAIDRDRSGFISQKEFIEACKILSRATKSDMTDKHIKNMAKHIDINQDGQIDVNEFLEAFTLVAKKE